MNIKNIICLTSAIAATTAASNAAVIRVEFTSTASAGFAPLAGVFHDGSVGSFNSGAASAGLEALAEGGNPASFLAEITAANSGAIVGSTDGQIGGTRPGSRSFDVVIPDGSNITEFNFASMFLPSNDWFITNSGAGSVSIASLIDGTQNSLSIGINSIYDAGTELEDFTRGGGTGTDPFGLTPRLSDANGGDPNDQDDDISLVTQNAGENLFQNFVNPNNFDISVFNDIVIGGADFATITLTVVPEPSSALLAGFGLIPLLRRRR